ncbi:hypothetical protein CRG98_040387 [Punica granatum]|uniref:Uncharacterized protein n=1 Tax=Punica granatum TaxID=22663 RepID=A0A2I0I5G0_PUNGR|nr:hypothetical protein CRG98_040387 [Punica granatum]
MDIPWFDLEYGNSSSEEHKSRNLPLQNHRLHPKNQFRVKSSLRVWRPDPRQQLILDNLWSSMKNPKKGEESMKALVLHMEELCHNRASLQQELCLENQKLQHELSLQKAHTRDFLQNRSKLQSFFGNNAWSLITKSLRLSASLSINIESSPPEWISSIKVQPAIHFIFISPVDSKVILLPEAKYWAGEDHIITHIGKWRAWVQGSAPVTNNGYKSSKKRIQRKENPLCYYTNIVLAPLRDKSKDVRPLTCHVDHNQTKTLLVRVVDPIGRLVISAVIPKASNHSSVVQKRTKTLSVHLAPLSGNPEGVQPLFSSAKTDKKPFGARGRNKAAC